MVITSKELRNKWIRFYEGKGHTDIGAVSLIGDGTTGVMFNVAGMQPLMPYLLGKKHPAGTRLCNVQGCVRTVDIESVGDASHFTFFEMMGNWSLGDYFKKEKTAWTFELLTEVFGLDKDLICSTVFEGNESAPRDEETAGFLKGLGIKPGHVFYLPKSDNWWELEGTVGTPCGPDNEWFYPIDGKEGRFPEDYVEIGNDVYMQYQKLEGNRYVPLENKNVDTGFGLDRMLLFLNGLDDGYKTDLFSGVIAYLEGESGKKYDEDAEARKAMRIIADHTRTTVMLIGDVNGILPSNTGAGYILRRLMRRAIRYCRKLGVPSEVMCGAAKIFIGEVYDEAYPLLKEKEEYILDEIRKEASRFETTLAQGMKEFDKCVNGIARKNAFMTQSNPDYVPETVIGGKQAFRLYDTYGFPLELTEELAAEQGYGVDKDGFDAAFKEHQEKSKATVHAGEFKGGLESHSDMAVKYHTATHLLNAALKAVCSSDINQKGSNITDERMRFDFNFPRPLTEEEIRAVEALVNEKIAEDLPVVYREMSLQEARDGQFVGVFDSKYGDVVKTYSIGEFSKEMCGGPHVEHTGVLGHFRIVKEQSSSAGVRRIKAVLE